MTATPSPEELVAQIDALLGFKNEVPRIPNLARQLLTVAAALIRELVGRVNALRPLAQFGSGCMECWPEGSMDGGELEDALKDCGLIAAVEGGFNESIHIDAHNCSPEPGDEWLMPTQAAIDARAALDAKP